MNADDDDEEMTLYPICSKWWDVIHAVGKDAVAQGEADHFLTALMHNAAVLAAARKEEHESLVTIFMEMLEGEADQYNEFMRENRAH